MGLVEDDDALEPCPGPRAGVALQPVDDLLDPRALAPALLGAQRGVGGEQDGVAELDGGVLAVARERDDVALGAAEGGPVADGVLDQLVGLGDPERPAPALEPDVEDDAGDLAALACPGAVAQEPAPPEAHGARSLACDRAHRVEGLVDRVVAAEEARMGIAGVDQALELGVGENTVGYQTIQDMGPVGRLGRRHRGHGRGLDELGRMGLGAGDDDGLDLVALVERFGDRSVGRRPVAGLIGELDHVCGIEPVRDPMQRQRALGRVRPVVRNGRALRPDRDGGLYSIGVSDRAA